MLQVAKKKSKSTKRKKKSAAAKKVQVVTIADLKEPLEYKVPVWVDRMAFSGREDGIVILIFETAIPDQGRRLEICRLAMTAKLAKDISEVIAGQIKVVEVEDDKKGRDM